MVKKIAWASLSLVTIVSVSLAGISVKNYLTPTIERSEILVYHQNDVEKTEFQETLESKRDSFLNTGLYIWHDVGTTDYQLDSDEVLNDEIILPDIDDQNSMFPPLLDEDVEEEENFLPDLDIPSEDGNIIPPLEDILPDIDSGTMGPSDDDFFKPPGDLLDPPSDDGLLDPPSDDGLLDPPSDDGLLDPPSDGGVLDPPSEDVPDPPGNDVLDPPSLDVEFVPVG